MVDDLLHFLISNKKKWHRVLLLTSMILVVFFYNNQVHAQGSSSFTVTGIVTEAGTGATLPGVNITIPGTTTGTTTNIDGEYEITASSPTDSLRFSYIGYEEQVIPIDNRNVINVTMELTVFSGSELVVVGYSAQERQNISGSVSSVDVQSLNRGTSGDVSKQIQGRVSGVSVISSGQPGEELEIRIRGINTFGNNSPLYVVDGVPTQDIATLNPNDIESMQVLKDASSASIYGARAANGVIIISTKRGSGDVQVSYNGYLGSNIPETDNAWNILSPQEMADLKWNAIRNSGGNPAPDPQYGSGSNPVLPDYIRPSGAMEGEVDEDQYFVNPNYTEGSALNDFNQIVRANKQGTDWYDEIFSPARLMNHDLTVSGGNDNGSYLVSFNYFDEQGTLNRTLCSSHYCNSTVF